MYTTPSSFIPSTFQMQIASPLFKTRPSNLPFSQFAICPIHHTKTLLSHSSFLISSQIQCQSIHQTHHFQFTHFQSHFKTFTTQTTFTNTSKHPFSNIKLLLKIDMKILVLESVWELRSHSLHWLSSKPIMHFPIWIFKKSSLHSEKFGRTSFSQHSQKFTNSHPSSRKLLLTSLTLRHSHGKPHSLTPQASTLSTHRFPPNSHTPPCSSTFKHVSHSHFYQWPHSLKNEQRIARSPSCLGVSPSFLAPTFILLDPSKRTFNPPSIPFPWREIPPNLSRFRPPNRPLFHPFFATSASTASHSSTHSSFSTFFSERVLYAVPVPSISWDPRGRGWLRSSRSSRLTLLLTPALTLAQSMESVGSQRSHNWKSMGSHWNPTGIPLESALRESVWKLQRVSKTRVCVSRVDVGLWWNSLEYQEMTEQNQSKPVFSM